MGIEGYYDADNHYYEAEDAFTRYQARDMANRCMQWVDMNGKRRLLVAGTVNRFIANPTFDPIARPGCLDPWYRGTNKVTDIRDAFGPLEPLAERPEYRDREQRLARMDQQGLAGALLFPTLAVGIEQALVHDIEALQHAFHAFNRWLHDDWGFAHEERLFAAPYFSLSDLDSAIESLEWAIAHDARVICMRPAPVPTVSGTRSPADPVFDPFWARVDEAGLTLAFHTGDSGYTAQTDAWEPFGSFRAFQFTPFRLLSSDRPIFDTIGALICHGLFARFPRIRVVSIENGAAWVDNLVKKLDKLTTTYGHLFAEHPVDTLRRHVYVSPFHEEDPGHYIDLLGAERIVFGSDFPHAEGLEHPGSYVADLAGQPDDVVERVMRTNTLGLTRRAG
jgi:predicted TIM-barrel fold metal-dependent hydrolase